MHYSSNNPKKIKKKSFSRQSQLHIKYTSDKRKIKIMKNAASSRACTSEREIDERSNGGYLKAAMKDRALPVSAKPYCTGLSVFIAFK